MLQQTRVEAVKAYYTRFLDALPTVETLAAADPDELMKLWEGLGYYTRARNLQAAAKRIVEAGAFPHTLETLRALPGIGDYTAGAIASIAFGLPEPAVDGNVLRVAMRLTNDDSVVDRQDTKRRVATALRAVYPLGMCAQFTQSLMELGACVCLPNGEPKCGACPLCGQCAARAANNLDKIPVRAPKKARRVEYRTVWVYVLPDGRAALAKRPDSGLLAGLWQYPDEVGRLDEVEARTRLDARGINGRIAGHLNATHIFTHIEWRMTGYLVVCGTPFGDYVWTDADAVALPTAFRQFDALRFSRMPNPID